MVVTEVRSESFGLVTDCCYYNGRLRGQLLSLSSVVSRAFSALCARYMRIRRSGIILTS